MKNLGIILIILSIILIIMGVIWTIKPQSPQSSIKESSEVETEETVIEKVSTLEKYFIDKVPIKNLQDITNQDKLYFSIMSLSPLKDKSISEETIKNVLKKYFGKDISYHNEDILIPNTQKILFKYNKEKKQYIAKNQENNNTNSYTLLSTAEIQNNKETIEIQKQYLFVDLSTSPYTLYTTEEKYLNKSDYIGVYDISTTHNILMSSIVKDYEEILPKIIYKFKKEGNSYILVSIQKID